jgi:hypothetical protein
MNRSLLLVLFLLVFIISTVKGGDNIINMSNTESDSSIRQIFSEYQNVLTTSKDESTLKKLFISENEWLELLKIVKEKQPNCISLDESEYDVSVNFTTYRDLISSKVKIKQLFVSKIEYNYSCGNLFIIPRVTCAVQYNNNEVVNVPFLLIKNLNNEYKIVRNFLNYKIFPIE